MSYSPATVANYFLNKASQEGRALTPMQVLKLVYIAHGWCLGYFKRPLITEPVQAWKYGPVIRSLYDDMKKYGSGAISELLPTAPFPWVRSAEVGPDVAPLLDSVWNSYARFSGVQLSAMTHLPGTPWHKAWTQGGHASRCAIIDDAVIQQHYEQKIAEMQARQEAHA